MIDDMRLKCGDTDLDLRAAYGLVADLGKGMCLADVRIIACRALRRAYCAEAEVEQLQGIVDDLAGRVAAQSTLPSRRAEGPPLQEQCHARP